MSVRAYPLNDTLYFAEDAQTFHCTRTTGVHSTDEDFIVTPYQANQIKVSAGIMWMKFNRFGGAAFVNDTDLYLDLEIADGILNRIDRIICQVDKITGDRQIYAKKGALSISPVPPSITRDEQFFEVAIADIYRPAGSVQVTAGNISDLRLNEQVCGIMQDSVTKIPTQQLFDQWEDWFLSLKLDAEKQAGLFIEWMEEFKKDSSDTFNEWFTSFVSANTGLFDDWFNKFTTDSEERFNEWFESIQAILDGDVAGNILNHINEHIEKTIFSDGGVHGQRIKDNKLQLEIGRGEWVTTNLSVIVGFTGKTFDYMSFTGASFDVKQFTGKTFDNYIVTEG